MKNLIHGVIGRSRTVALAFLVIVIAGIVSYNSMPKEAEPEVSFPYIMVEMMLDGVSPEDAERLLVRPMEQELRNLSGLKEMVASAAENRATVTAEFEPEVSIEKALTDVRERVDLVKAKLPADAEEPRVKEMKFAEFSPMLVMNMGGQVPERTLYAIVDDLKDRLERLSGVLEVKLVGVRDEQLEVVIDPLAMESYGLSPADVLSFVDRNNRLVAAGSLQAEQGRFAIKVPGLIQSPQDVLRLPIKVDGDNVVHFEDIATVRRSYKDPESYARLNGQPAIAMEAIQRSGANVLTTVDEIKKIVDEVSKAWPPGVELTYSLDKSVWIRNDISTLVNNVVAAILLVFICLIGILGLQNALLVGIAIPGSFCAAFFLLHMFGIGINMVVLFGAIMAVGLLVDGAIVVTELADRKMTEGVPRRAAYTEAATRMAWPIIASTATTLAAFLPLVFWPGLIGNFLKFLPITLIATLSASLVMALLFVPSMGTMIGRPGRFNERIRRDLLAAETGNLGSIGGWTGRYIGVMDRAMRHPWLVLGAISTLLVSTYVSYGLFGNGISMFPEVEPAQGNIEIRARGDLSTQEKDRIVRQVEDRIYGIDGMDSIYVRSGMEPGGNGTPDMVGSIRLNFTDWRARNSADEIMEDIRRRVGDIPGIIVDTRLPEEGPQQGKPLSIELSGNDLELLKDAADKLRRFVEKLPGTINVEDTRPLPGIEWRLQVDRAQAARFGADVTLVGSIIQLVTNGIRLGEYRPDDADDELEIRVRFPADARSLDALGELRIPTQAGNVPIGTFVKRVPAEATRTIMRTNMRRTLLVQSDLRTGVQIAPILQAVRDAWPELGIDPGIQPRFKGGAQDQADAMAFLSKAFALALGLMAMILVTQFNSLFQAFLILTAVVFSTGGVMLGLLVTNQSFSLINCGIGAIALAGIVVNNNIVLIDTYNRIRTSGMRAREAIIRTCAQRLRPVMLTTVTTVLGLLPMAAALNIDLVNRDVYFGGPGTQWWKQMASVIAGGLLFSTILTLMLTPAMLMIQANVSRRLRNRRARRAKPDQEALAS